MVVRLVKMTFKEGKAEEFVSIFQHSKKKIRDFRGCIFLEVLRDTADPNVFFTYSVWSSEDDLNRYRDSELFKETWAKAKALFAKDPEAYSTKRIDKA
jgi:(4S)-4-hydroxy-5-phosphonooxypentane-2,3-dione isomerase